MTGSIEKSCYYYFSFKKKMNWIDANNFCSKHNLTLLNYITLSVSDYLKVFMKLDEEDKMYLPLRKLFK